MAQKEFDPASEKQSPEDPVVDEEKLTRILGQPTWTPEQAEQILAAQVRSGLTIAQFAKQRGLTPGRLYNWKSKLRPAFFSAPNNDGAETDSETEVDVQDVGLDLQDPGERFMYDYLLRATKGPEPMWRLLATGRQGSVLLCVVRWMQSRAETGAYSLVKLELTEPALRWTDFATAEAATQALGQRGSAKAWRPKAPRVPPLLPLTVRSLQATQGNASAVPQPEDVPAPCMTLCLPSGVRIQIGSQIPKPLLRTVLRAVGALSC